MRIAPLLAAAAFAALAPAAIAQQGEEIRVLLAPELETTLVSPMLGRIRNVNVTLGSNVTKDCQEQAARVAMSQAELVGARENHEAKLRLQALQSAGEVEVNLAAAAVDKARAQLELSKVQAGQCSVLAPFNGRAVRIHVKAYQGVTAGQPLVELVSSGPFKLRLNVPSKWLAWLKPGTPFDVVIDETGRTYPARVTAINGRVDAASQSIELEARIDDKSGELVAGMSGAAQFKPPR